MFTNLQDPQIYVKRERGFQKNDERPRDDQASEDSDPKSRSQLQLVIYKSSFGASEFINGLGREFHVTRESAVKVAKSLQKESRILRHVIDDHGIQ